MTKYANLFKPAAHDHPLIDRGEQAASSSSSFSLLFVDDEKNVRKSLKRIFMEENYRILIAGNGTEDLASPCVKAARCRSTMIGSAVHSAVYPEKMNKEKVESHGQ
jgi:response regulator RpfG family c-di-GMP phosphodiesterase